MVVTTARGTEHTDTQGGLAAAVVSTVGNI